MNNVDRSEDISVTSIDESGGGNHKREIRLWLRMLSCTTLIESDLRRRFRDEFNFTLPRFEVLAQLDREPLGLVLNELSKRLMVSAGNLTPIIERLIEDGYISRSVSSLDRRLQIVCLTVEGRRKFRRMAKKNGEWLASIFAAVPAEEIDRLTEQMATLKRVVATKDQTP